jgi:hypothetical protein
MQKKKGAGERRGSRELRKGGRKEKALIWGEIIDPKHIQEAAKKGTHLNLT